MILKQKNETQTKICIYNSLELKVSQTHQIKVCDLQQELTTTLRKKELYTLKTGTKTAQ